jgi:hypothetical protein
MHVCVGDDFALTLITIYHSKASTKIESTFNGVYVQV